MMLYQPIPDKRCSKCKLWHSGTPDSFSRNKKECDGLNRWCKGCYQAYAKENAEAIKQKNKEWAKANPERSRENRRRSAHRYAAAHPDRVKARKAAWDQANAEHRQEYDRQYHIEHREQKLAYKRVWRERTREHRLEYGRQYREDHREELNRKAAEWRKTHLEHRRAYKRAYYAANHEQENERARLRRHSNRDAFNAARRGPNRTYRLKNRKRVLERQRAWRVAHPGYWRSAKNNRRARQNAADGVHTAEDVTRQYQAQNGRCFWCSEPVKCHEADHVIPLSRGGSNWPENIVISCLHCNRSKANKLPYTEWTPPNPLDPHAS